MKQPTNVIEFWVVWNPQGLVPMKRHTTEASAIIESKRLANQLPGKSFYVLKSTSVARGVEERKTTVTVETTRPAPTPQPPAVLGKIEYIRPAPPANGTQWFKGTEYPVVLSGKIYVVFKDGFKCQALPARVVWENVAWWHYL